MKARFPLTMTLSLVLAFLQTEVLSQSLVSYYPLDGNAMDFGPWLNHGTINGAIPYPDRHGNPNGAMYFGQGNSIDVPQLPSISNGSGPFGFGPYTIVLWANFANVLGNNAFLCLGDNNSPTSSEFNITFSTSTTNMLQLNKYTGQTYSVESQTINTTAWDNQWIMLAVKFNGINHMVASNFTFYRNTFTSLTANTVIYNCSTCPAGYPYPLANSLHLGWAPGGKHLNGALDDVRIYNYALSDSAIFALFTLNTTSVAEESSSLDFIIYPNPTSDFLNIEISPIKKFKSISIIDVTGREVYHSTFSNSNEKIDIKNLPSGIYALQVCAESEQKLQKKFVVE